MQAGGHRLWHSIFSRTSLGNQTYEGRSPSPTITIALDIAFSEGRTTIPCVFVIQNDGKINTQLSNNDVTKSSTENLFTGRVAEDMVADLQELGGVKKLG